MKVKALSAQAAEFLLEKPQPTPLLLSDAESLAATPSNADASAGTDAPAKDTVLANNLDTGVANSQPHVLSINRLYP